MRDGDSDAFRTLVERHGRSVDRIAHRITFSDAAALNGARAEAALF